MFAFRRIEPTPPLRRRIADAGGVCVLALGLLAARPALAAAPQYPDILPLRLVKPGMTGYGLTTFKGNTISRFQVTVVGILKKANLGRDLILIRMKGGPITERGANLIQGMSGSPIYINGKIIGAFSMGEAFPKEPVGMVTPIEDMLEAWDPNIPQRPPYFQPAEPEAPTKSAPAATPPKTGVAPTRTGDAYPGTRRGLTGWRSDSTVRVVDLPAPLVVGNRRLTRLVLNARANDPRPSTASLAVLHRATSLLSVTGISGPGRLWLQKELDQRGLPLTVAQDALVGRKSDFKAAPLRPGSAFGTFLATGDVQVGGTGTVTYRRGNRMLGFGHPLFGLGALNGAITSAYIVDVFSGFQTSHHIAVAGPVIGTLVQDRDFSVSGELGRKPNLIPFDVTVRDETTRREETFHSQLFQHPDLTALLLRLVAREAITRVHNTPGDAMAKVTTTLDAAEVGRVSRTNVVFDSSELAATATGDLNDITGIVSGNPFYPLPIKSARMTVDITSGHNTATVERIFLKQGRYEPGDTLDVGVVLKPYRRDPITRSITLKIPSDTPSGRYQLAVRGGTASVTRIGPFVISSGATDPQTPPVNVRQMVARLNQHEYNTDLVARLVLNTIAPALEGEKLSQLPPNLSALMRSDRNSGVRLERDELRTTAPTDYVVSGSQQLVVTVVRKNSQETGVSSGLSSSSGGASSLGGSPPSLVGGSGLSASANDDDASADNTSDKNGNEKDGDNETKNRSARPAAATESARVGDTPDLTAGLPLLETDPARLRWMAAVTPGLETLTDPPAAPNGGKTGGTKPDAKPTNKKLGKTDPTKPADAPTADASTTATVAPITPAPPVASDATADKPVGRQLQVWRQTARADFASGKFAGTSVTAGGELRLAPTLRRLVSTSETYIWALTSDAQGNLYAGTGTSGKILKIDPSGNASVFATLPVVSVQSLLLAADGTLWAGSGVKGALYHIGMDGAAKLMGSLPEKYILALAQDKAGNLYVGPGGGGTVYRLSAADQRASVVPTGALKPYVKTNADHIMALATDAQDNLYVGTGNDGIVYKITPDGKSGVLYDAKENAITALAPDGQGNLYVGTGPKGLLYRIAPDGTATLCYDRATTFFTAIRPAPDKTFYAATVNAIYHVSPTPGSPAPVTVQPLDNPRDVDFLTMTVLPNGNVAAGTGNIGEIYTTNPTDPTVAGTAATTASAFESVVHDARLVSQWGTARWNASLAPGTGLRVETRTGNVAEPDATWSAWTPVQTSAGASEGTIASPPARFLQYRLLLRANTGGATAAPAVREVSFSYLPRNQSPRVAFTSPSGGERWAKTQTVRWNGTDPDNDTLTYDLTYSTDGLTWKPLPTEAKPAALAASDSAPASAPTPVPASTPTATPAANPARPPLTLAEFQQRLDARPNIPAPLKKMMLENYQRNTASGGAATGSLHETSKALDTKTLPDGTYWLKVTASDQASNPTDPQTAQVVSDPFVICNTPPKITLGKPQVLTLAGSAVASGVSLEGAVAQNLIAVSAVQYRVDGGDWLAAAPKDGLFDSSREAFTLVTGPLAKGSHVIELTAFNAANLKATEKMTVEVP